MSDKEKHYHIKAPQDVVFDLPQERITGDILRGYGPRRGNLERLLRYWRPIMRKPGGFRRCRVILADHPELYPLSNICAWLHHETTGLWPNEGCHHPGMKNCRGKLKKRNWTNAEFARNLRGAIRAPQKLTNNVGKTRALGKSEDFIDGEEDFYSSDIWRQKTDEINVLTVGDMQHASKVLAEFVQLEPDFVKYLRDDNNWEIDGEDHNGLPVTAPYDGIKCCG